MKGVLKAMFFTKLKLAVAVVLVGALGAGGIAYQAGPSAARAQAPAKPRSELEELRRQVELLKLNLEGVLEKVRAPEAQLRSLRAEARDGKVRFKAKVAAQKDREIQLRAQQDLLRVEKARREEALRAYEKAAALGKREATADPVKEVEAALKALREATDRA